MVFIFLTAMQSQSPRVFSICVTEQEKEKKESEDRTKRAGERKMKLLNKTALSKGRQMDTFPRYHKIASLNTIYYFSCTESSARKTFTLISNSVHAVMKILSI